MSSLHQAEVMPVPAPTARVSYGTMGWLMRMNLASTLFMNLLNGKENMNNRISQRGKCNLPSSIGTFLLNSLSRFLCPWELRLALQSESKVLFPQSFELDACSRIDFCLAQSFLHGRNKRKTNNNILLRSWSCLQISESRNCCFTTSQMWCVMKSCLEKNRSTNSSTWSAEPGERRLPVGKTFQTKSNISC